jgi:hypothetical protein
MRNLASTAVSPLAALERGRWPCKGARVRVGTRRYAMLPDARSAADAKNCYFLACFEYYPSAPYKVPSRPFASLAVETFYITWLLYCAIFDPAQFVQFSCVPSAIICGFIGKIAKVRLWDRLYQRDSATSRSGVGYEAGETASLTGILRACQAGARQRVPPPA